MRTPNFTQNDWQLIRDSLREEIQRLKESQLPPSERKAIHSPGRLARIAAMSSVLNRLPSGLGRV